MIQGLPERLRELRQRHSLSQREVAKRLGVSPSIISGYETGERTPSAENVLALAVLYQCSTDHLLGREAVHLGETISAAGLSRKQTRLITELINTISVQNGCAAAQNKAADDRA